MTGKRETETGTLDGFLLARIAEEEKRCWELAVVPGSAFVLAECDAKRRIVNMCADDADLAMNYRSAIKAATSEWHLLSLARDVLKTLALPYADHPDYRPEWRPGGER